MIVMLGIGKYIQSGLSRHILHFLPELALKSLGYKLNLLGNAVLGKAYELTR